MSRLAKSIEIVLLPHGEAPEEVRAAWIGCILPCDPECGHTLAYASGVLTGTVHGKIDGFSVPQEDALLILGSKSPQAAAWFREHGFPHHDESFRFRREEAQVLTTYTDDELSALGPIHFHDDMETGTMRQLT